MEMVLIGQDSTVASYVKDFGEENFFNIVKFIINLSINDFDVYEELYVSKFKQFPDAYQKQLLDKKIQSLKDKYPYLETNDKSNGYNWVFVKRKEVGDEAFRFYFGVNPMNMYKIVEKLTEKFSMKGLPVSFKYQKDSKADMADRIILYTSKEKKNEVERTIKEVFNENRELFYDGEKALPWIYNIGVPNVFIAPEEPEHIKSYGQRFSSMLCEAKSMFYYFYQEDKVRNQEQLEFLKKLVLSSMLRNGLLLTKKDGRMMTEERGIKTFYKEETGSLVNVIDEKDGYYYEAKYDNSLEGKKAYLKNFYTVKNVRNQPGVTVRCLTRQERIQDIYNTLYPHLANGPKK